MSGNGQLEENKHVIRTLYENLLNEGRLDQLSRVIAEDYVGIYGQRGPSAYAETIQALRQGFPDIQWSIEDLVAEDDRVAVRWTWKGTHTGSFRGIPASHERVTDKAIAIYQIRDGKVVRGWMETDRLGLLQQIGALPKDAVPQPPAQGD